MMLKTKSRNQIKKTLLQYKEYILAGAIILGALLLRLGILSHTVDFHGVANGKILEALMIINNPANIKLWTPVHPPAHILFLIAGIKLFGSFMLIPRLISLGFGIMTIVVFYLYLKRVFDQEIALFSILGISLYSAHIVYSIIATSETSFHFFLFLSLYVYELFKQKAERYLLILLGLCVGMAGMCRYEGLLLIPFYIVFLRKNKLALSEFTIHALIFPGIWLLVNYAAFGNAFEFISSNNFIVPQQINWIRGQGGNIDFAYKLLFWPRSLIQTLGIGVFAFGLAGVLYSGLKGRIKELSAIFIMFFSVFVLNTLRETLYLQPRYGITLGLILIPFSVYLFIKVLEQLNRKIPKWIVLILLWTMIIPIGELILASPLYLPVFAKNTALFLETNSNSLENIMIDHCGDEKYREPIKVLSRINPLRFVLIPQIINEKNEYALDENKFFQALREENITTLVYSPYGQLKTVLNLNAQNAPQQRQGFLFILKYKSAPYFIYDIQKVKNND
ncbi:MAG: glycosyltransferase family 39 protein [Candidatus Omnitrophota bacterium]